jgi:hypothetical protein
VITRDGVIHEADRLEREGDPLLGAVFRRIASLYDRENAVANGVFRKGDTSRQAVIQARIHLFSDFWYIYLQEEGDSEA